MEHLNKPIGFYIKGTDTKDGKRMYTKSSVEITPLYDSGISKLSAQDRSREVIDRQVNYWRPLLKEKYPNLYEGKRRESIRLLETMFDLGYREWEVDHYQSLLEYNTQEREEKEEEIKRTYFGKQRRRRLNDLEESNETLVTDIVGNKNTASQLRNAVLDSFVKEIFLKEGSHETILLSIEDLITHTDYNLEDVSNLVVKAANRVDQIYLGDDVLFLHYKSSDEHFTRKSEAGVLNELIEMSVGSDEDSNMFERGLRTLSQNILELYWKNLYRFYQSGEDLPITHFSHDYFYAASLTDDINSFIKRSEWLIIKLEENEGEFGRELDTAYERRIEEEIGLQRKIRGLYLTNEEDSTEGFVPYLSQPPIDFTYDVASLIPDEYIIGKYYDRTNGLESVFKLFDNRDKTHLISLISSAQMGSTVPGKDLAFFVANHWKYLMSPIKDVSTLYDVSVVHAEKQDYHSQATEFRERFGLPEILEGRTEFALDASKKLFHLEHLLGPQEETTNRDVLKANALVNTLFVEQSPSSTQETQQLFAQNAELIRKIRDENRWFVAVNGDSFKSDKNQDLNKYDISKAVFYPSRETKGGHRVRIHSVYKDEDGAAYGIDVLIKRNGRIEFPEHPNLIIPNWLNAGIQNFLLKRINFISSGALSVHEKGNQEIGGDEHEKEVLVRRSHYRYLTSTEKRKYTLQSPEAKKHAKYVLRVYGIDIYEENLRRRRAKTLGQNQVITFVKEVEKGYSPPNELIFNPDFESDKQ